MSVAEAMLGTGVLMAIVGAGLWLIAAFWQYVSAPPTDDDFSRTLNGVTRWTRRLGRGLVSLGVVDVVLSGAVSLLSRLA